MLTFRPGEHPLRNLAVEIRRSTVERGDGAARTDDAHAGVSPASDPSDPLDVARTEAVLGSGPGGLLRALDEAGTPRDANILICLDQFEELFRFRAARKNSAASAKPDGGVPTEDVKNSQAVAQRDDSATLVSLLLNATVQTERSIYVVITMRSDFLGDCDVFRGLPEAINDGQFLTPRMTREQTREAIVGPARLFGGALDSALINQILNEMGDEPDQLPLMQHILMRCWRHASKEDERPIRLTRERYVSLGGLPRGLSNHGDDIYKSLASEGDRRVAQLLFRSLCDRSADQRLTRRFVKISEIAAIANVDCGQVRRVVEQFQRPGRNFLVVPDDWRTSDEATIDLSHESLIRQWGTLQRWLAEEEEGARIYRRLAETTERFQNGEAGRLRPPELTVTLRWFEAQRPTQAWARRYGGDFDACVEFLRRSRNSDLRFRAGAILLVMFIVALALNAWQGWRDADAAKQKTKQLLDSRTSLYTGPTEIGGRIIRASHSPPIASDSDQRKTLVRRAREELNSRPLISSEAVDQALRELDSAIENWNERSTIAADRIALDRAVLHFARAFRNEAIAELQYYKSETRTAWMSYVTERAYRKAMRVTQAIAEGDRSAKTLQEFEALYWSELVLLESGTVVRLMIEFREAIEPDPDKLLVLIQHGSERALPNRQLGDLAGKLRLAFHSEMQNPGLLLTPTPSLAP
ncbi:MAG TPA: hypothetical protein PLV92_13855, partial [Pirellulaceae bacterium]|nr:hypothetical protein [Pirellulaceae bacterium]